MRGVEELIITPRRIVRLGAVQTTSSYPVVLQISSEPLTDDRDSSTGIIVVTLAVYIFAWPLYIVVCVSWFGCCKAKKEKLSERQLWGNNPCCFCFKTCICCGDTEFGKLDTFVDEAKLAKLEVKDPFRLRPGCGALNFYRLQMKAYYTRLSHYDAFSEIFDSVIVIVGILTHFIQVFMYDYFYLSFRFLSFSFLVLPLLMFGYMI